MKSSNPETRNDSEDFEVHLSHRHGERVKQLSSSPIPPTPPPRNKNTLSWCDLNYTEDHYDTQKDPNNFSRSLLPISSNHIGLMSLVYPKFKLAFWIDKLLLVTGVFVPILVSVLLILIHAFTGISHCISEKDGLNPKNSFIDKACGLLLSFNVLQGTVIRYGFNFNQASLQHECYPFLLLLIALFMWIPHYLWRKSIECNARRDLSFIRGELHSFRENLAKEMANFPLSQVPKDAYQTITQVDMPFISNNNIQPQHGGLISPTIGIQSSRTLTKFTEVDFSSPGLSELPCMRACDHDWSLISYISIWQNSEFYWRRYLTKHAILSFLQIINLFAIISVLVITSGAPFAALYKCKFDTTDEYVCMLSSTFLANMSVLALGLLCGLGLGCQFYFFYKTFYKNGDIFARKDGHSCFFGDYLRLLAYGTFRDSNRQIRNLNITASVLIFRTDFHLLSLMCLENMELLPDALHIHFWMERYARLVHAKHQGMPLWLRSKTISQLIRCEDLSLKFNFTKIRIKLEVIDV